MRANSSIITAQINTSTTVVNPNTSEGYIYNVFMNIKLIIKTLNVLIISYLKHPYLKIYNTAFIQLYCLRSKLPNLGNILAFSQWQGLQTDWDQAFSYGTNDIGFISLLHFKKLVQPTTNPNIRS